MREELGQDRCVERERRYETGPGSHLAVRARVVAFEFQPHSLASSSIDSAPADRPCFGSIPSLVFAERLDSRPAH